MQPRAEHIGKFRVSKRRARAGAQVQQDLVAFARKLSHGPFHGVPRDHEKTAHGIGELGPDDSLREHRGEIAHSGASPVPRANAAAGDVS